MEKERSLKTLTLDGGALAFHFINTVYAWRGENLHEYLSNYETFLDWCRKVGMLHPALLAQLRANGHRHPKKMATAFQRILSIRRLFYHLFSEVAAQNASVSLLEQYNIILHEALSHFEWVGTRGQLSFSLKEDATDLLMPLWVLVQSAHQLLLEEDPSRIKECPRCGWIFLDTTKNNKRRWCSPNTCGSVEKMHRYYQKIRKERVKEE